MKKNSTAAEYWSARYRENQTGWDIGAISTPLKTYIDQLGNKEQKILIPGAGNAYEAEYLFRKGFKNVYVAELAEEPLQNLQKRVPEFPQEQLLHIDFFEVEGSYDLILEQTFFCALPVDRRADYARKAFELLRNKGKIVGLLFTFELAEDGPPFGGSKQEYLEYFDPLFEIEILEPSYNSIPPRQGNELFFKFVKKTDQ